MPASLLLIPALVCLAAVVLFALSAMATLDAVQEHRRGRGPLSDVVWLSFGALAVSLSVTGLAVSIVAFVEKIAP